MTNVDKVLKEDPRLKEIPNDQHKVRKEHIQKTLFTRVYQKVYHSLLNKDKLPFALKLCQISTGESFGPLFKSLLKPNTLLTTSLSS